MIYSDALQDVGGFNSKQYLTNIQYIVLYCYISHYDIKILCLLIKIIY